MNIEGRSVCHLHTCNKQAIRRQCHLRIVDKTDTSTNNRQLRGLIQILLLTTSLMTTMIVIYLDKVNIHLKYVNVTPYDTICT